jgi:hypothetical protein
MVQGVRGNKWRILKFRSIITPTLPSPVEGEEKTGTAGWTLIRNA